MQRRLMVLVLAAVAVGCGGEMTVDMGSDAGAEGGVFEEPCDLERAWTVESDPERVETSTRWYAELPLPVGLPPLPRVEYIACELTEWTQGDACPTDARCSGSPPLDPSECVAGLADIDDGYAVVECGHRETLEEGGVTVRDVGLIRDRVTFWVLQ